MNWDLCVRASQHKKHREIENMSPNCNRCGWGEERESN
jgi:hypothetical protein